MWQGENLGYSAESFSDRLNVLQFGIFFLLGIISFRIISLQVIKGEKFRKISDENRIVIYPQPATRGKIFDRNMNVIVDNKPSFAVLFSRQTMEDEEVKNVITKVARLLSLSDDAANALLERTKMIPGKNFSLLKIAQNISKYQAIRLAEKTPQLPGVVVRIEPVRVYTLGASASHITGYVREASLGELSEIPNLKAGDIIGKNGIEKQYDEILRGIDGGSQVEVNARAIQKRILETVEPVDGDSIVLTIDKKIQMALSNHIQGHMGVAIAIDPNTGGILGLVSYPDYNPNLFISGLNYWQMPYLLRSEKKPLWNRALQGQYPPGSVYKLVTAFAGLESGVITPQTIITCKGFIELGKYKQKFRCWARGGHGDMRLSEAIAQSCDVYFYEVGLKLGPTKLNEWAEKFGFGVKTGIDLPSEEKGLTPDKSWKKAKLHQDWYDGDTVNMSVGQGYIWTTPIQIAQFISAIANDGIIFQPHILKKIIDASGNVKFENVPKIKRKLDIAEDYLAAVKKGMTDAVRYGTGKNAKVVGLSVSGKTGTAQNPQGGDHAWFVCFAPSEKPKIALVVMIEHGGGGGEVAAPIAKRMLEEIFEKKCE
ncbi:MAG: penicillin-binding protein 2 [Elusimicrobia bacterium CG06_land_8_20_14_3_00_38_11]|nr:MAG: penicillin-binding protein 2 [Elusimicrobia bacterium CG06_land_8_20_14_3_00_38_11]